MGKIPIIQDLREKEGIIYFLKNNNHIENYDKKERDNIRKKSRHFLLFNNELHINENNALKKYLFSFDEEGKYEILQMFHNSDHIGGKNLYLRIKEKFIGISRDECLNFVRNCVRCQRAQQIDTRPIQITPIIPNYPRERLIIDAIDMRPYRNQNNNLAYIFTFIDSFTKFGWAYEAQDKSGQTFSSILNFHIQKEGKWRKIHTDNGREFVNENVNIILRKYNIDILHGRPYHPQSQGQVERFNGTIKDRLRKTTVHFNRWIEHLQDIIYNYNNTPHRSTGVKPFILFRTHDPSADLYLQNLDINFDFEQIQTKMFLYIQKWKDEYDSRQFRRNFNVGDRVLIAKNYNLRYIRRNGALDLFYEEEHYIIIEMNNVDSLVRRAVDNFEKRVFNNMIKKIN